MFIFRKILAFLIFLVCLFSCAMLITSLIMGNPDIALASGIFLVLFLFVFILVKPKKKTESSKQKEQVEEKSKKGIPKKRVYSLDGIAEANSLRKKDYFLQKIEEIETKAEKSDPIDLPENASDDRYDRVSEQYDFYMSQIQRLTDAIEIFDKLGPEGGGHDLTRFNSSIDISFTYRKESGDETERHVQAVGFSYVNYHIYLLAKDGDIEKNFKPDRIFNFNSNGFDSIYKFLVFYANETLESIMSTNTKDSE